MAMSSAGCPFWSAVSSITPVIAALGGFYLVSHQLRSRPLPSAVVLIHGGAAVVALLLLLWYLFQA